MSGYIGLRAVTAAVFVVSLGSLSACDSATRSIPTPMAPSAPVPPSPVPDPPRATLEVSNFSVTEVSPHSGQRDYVYLVKFWLKETSGTSGATVLSVWSSAGAGSDLTDAGCWRERIRVEPGGTLDFFDKGWKDLGYCAPITSSSIPAQSVGIVIAYIDDEGRRGLVDALAPVAR